MTEQRCDCDYDSAGYWCAACGHGPHATDECKVGLHEPPEQPIFHDDGRPLSDDTDADDFIAATQGQQWNYRAARAIGGWKEGDPMPEDTIAEMRGRASARHQGAIPPLPPVWYVEETGWLIKGHGLSTETIKNAVELSKAGQVEDYDVNPAVLYESREIWVRKAQTLFSRGEGYAWEMQETEPHARGAGRFTLVDIERCATCVSPHPYRPHITTAQAEPQS